MSAAAVLAVALGAALGAPLRFAVERLLVATTFPRGTWVVNVVGSLVLGGLLGWCDTRGGTAGAPVLVALVGTGFCGGLTTFGGFAAQTLDLATGADVLSTRSARALGYALASVVACVLIAWVGFAVGGHL